MTKHHVGPTDSRESPKVFRDVSSAGSLAHMKQSGCVNSYSKPQIRHRSVYGTLMMAFRVQDSFFLAGLDLSSLTRDQTQGLGSENAESFALVHQGIPRVQDCEEERAALFFHSRT